MLLLLFSEAERMCVLCRHYHHRHTTPVLWIQWQIIKSTAALWIQRHFNQSHNWDVCLCQSEVQDVPLSKSTFQCFVQMDVARLWSKLSNLFWNWNISERNEISILEKSCTEKSNLKLLSGKDSFIGKKIRFPGKPQESYKK